VSAVISVAIIQRTVHFSHQTLPTQILPHGLLVLVTAAEDVALTQVMGVEDVLVTLVVMEEVMEEVMEVEMVINIVHGRNKDLCA